MGADGGLGADAGVSGIVVIVVIDTYVCIYSWYQGRKHRPLGEAMMWEWLDGTRGLDESAWMMEISRPCVLPRLL